MNMYPLLDTILNDIPAPDVDADGPVAMQVCTIDHSSTKAASALAACIQRHHPYGRHSSSS